jgi:hypothetical protein
VKRRTWFVIGYLASEAVVLTLVLALIWNLYQSPTFRYRVLGTDSSMRAVLGTLERGMSMEDVQARLGQRHLDPDSEYSVRQGLRKLVETYPKIFVQGYENTDVILVYSTREFRYGLQFREGRLVGTCSQRGAKIVPGADEETPDGH